MASLTDEALKDSIIGPIIITALTTAMRRGDCCLLRWRSVDLKGRMLCVKTSKTGGQVWIPLFPLLEAELRRRWHGQAAQDYVFPEQAMMFRTNPDGITLRVEKLLSVLGFSGEEESPDECGARGGLTKKRDVGLRRASIRGLHSFRATWITLALIGSVPIELVQMVTGHRTVQVVLKNYFHPRAEELRSVLESKMPGLLLTGTAAGENGTTDRLETIRSLANRLDHTNWAEIKESLLFEISQLRRGNCE